MFYNTNKSVFARMQVDLARPKKDIIAIAFDRPSAQATAELIQEEILNYGHVETGKMLESVTATYRDGEHVVTAVDYLKYVNGRDKEEGQAGFVQDGVTQAIRDGFGAEATV